MGLSPAEVKASRDRHGDNTITVVESKSAWKKLLEKFTGPFGHHFKGINDGDPLVFILEVVGVLSVIITCAQYWHWFGLENSHGKAIFFEPVGIWVAILLATVIAFVFENKAENEFAVLNKVNDDIRVRVIRDGNPCYVLKRDVVVGDIVMLSQGDEIPADGCLLEATAMNVDESTLTGEPICHKSADPDESDPEATYPTNMVYRGTKVMEGHGVMEVTAVGDSSEDGKLMHTVQIDNSVRTPLNEQLDRLGHAITVFSYTVASLIVVGHIGLLIWDGNLDWIKFTTEIIETVMIAVTLVVVSVPEGLPMAVTLSLAYSMRQMLQTNNLVRRMHACETMGAATVICTDKTGTLTKNQMRVHTTVFSSLKDGLLSDNDESRLVADSIALNSTAELDLSDPNRPTVLGNPTEGALLLWLWHHGVDYNKLRLHSRVLFEMPFSTTTKYMATIVKNQNGRRLLLKGAPEVVMRLCDDDTPETKRMLAYYQERALRTLAFAWREVTDDETLDESTLTSRPLTMLGMVAISDPVRDEVPDAVVQCRRAGIDVKIITGDTIGTAREIGRETGIWDDGGEVYTGPDFAAMSDDQLDKYVDNIKIIARAQPMDKKRLVEALQRRGQVVAVTGDGTNDAPALKAAHVGLSMGDGTSVAREASDITIIDNSFASIAKAVMWGRSLYRNIQRFIIFQLTVNVAACLIVLAGSLMGKESPLTVTQMLWVNLIMDTFAAMALASLPPTTDVMSEKPRQRKAFIINGAMGRMIVGMGLLFTVVMLAMIYIFEHTDITKVTTLTGLTKMNIGEYNGLNPYEKSLIFTTFVMLQFWNLFNAKAFFSRHSAFNNLKQSRFFVFIAAVIFIGQILIVQIGDEMFNVCPLNPIDWGIIIGATSLVLLFGEAKRLIVRLLRPRH